MNGVPRVPELSPRRNGELAARSICSQKAATPPASVTLAKMADLRFWLKSRGTGQPTL